MMNFPYRQQGLSLIELMVAMVLGLLLVAGALQMMLTSQTIYRTTDTLSRIQENGRFALNFLTKDIRMAGYNTTEDINANGKVFWDGACDTSNPCTINGAGSDSDQIGILMDPSNDKDCQGNDVGKNQVIVNVYSIADLDNPPDQVNSLYCQGFNLSANDWVTPSPQPLVDGIENMQILYGVSNPTQSNTITSYVSADTVTNWANIGAARVSLLVNNGQPVGNGDSMMRTFNLLDADQIAPDDKHNRQVFSTTITINNIIYQSQESNQ
jgi:type IV pilus assembly protein PilW